MKMHLVFLWIWMGTISLGMFQMGFANVMFSSVAEVLFDQFEEFGNTEGAIVGSRDMFNLVMITAVPAGAVLGSLSGGYLVAYGRRKAILGINVVLCLATGMTMIFNFYPILIGRIFVGYCVGVLGVVCPMFLSETSFVKVSGPVGAISQVMITAGIMLAYLFRFLTPINSTDDDKDLERTNSWRYVFMIPGIVALVQSFLLLLVFTDDTPKYYRQVRDERRARRIESLIDPDASRIDLMVGDSQSIVEEKVSLCQQFSPKYRCAFLIGCLLAIYQQLTGINVVILYTNQIIFSSSSTDMNEDSEDERIITSVVGLVNLLSALFSVFLQKKFGRKFLFLVGNIGMCLSLLSLAIYTSLGNNGNVFVITFTLCFVLFFEIGVGSIFYIYISEIMTEVGISVAMTIIWALTVVISLITQTMIKSITRPGTYFLFFGINTLFLLFITFLVKETKGLSKSELKYLYSDHPKTYEPLAASRNSRSSQKSGLTRNSNFRITYSTT
ncbi:unnamed protein product [Moneuplotes crassus]|uniref:Hexose transporter 1 n=1 Tax=Euplotes crassus TaxID=5936 RepID=A0AAD1XE95_EUPCR|nr:unnamed protein product [Moneuplotes crassus]